MSNTRRKRNNNTTLARSDRLAKIRRRHQVLEQSAKRDALAGELSESDEAAVDALTLDDTAPEAP